MKHPILPYVANLLGSIAGLLEVVAHETYNMDRTHAETTREWVLEAEREIRRVIES